MPVAEKESPASVSVHRAPRLYQLPVHDEPACGESSPKFFSTDAAERALTVSLVGSGASFSDSALEMALLGIDEIKKRKSYEAASAFAESLAALVTQMSEDRLADILRVLAQRAESVYFADLVEALGTASLGPSREPVMAFLQELKGEHNAALSEAARNALDLIESDV